jgi:signal transduction histidine kinase
MRSCGDAAMSDLTRYELLGLVRLLHEKDRRLQAQRELLAVASHDLRGPLSAILAGTELILRTPDPVPGRRRTAETIRRSAHRMERLINDLFDVAAIDAGQLTVERTATEVDWLLEQTRDFEPAAIERGVKLQIERPNETMAVLCETERIVQVLSNLITNALKYSPPGSAVRVGARRSDGHIEVYVEDGGPGIPPELLSRIFDRFTRAQFRHGHDGIGLGLAIAQGIVLAHGGQIWAENRTDGPGARFTFSLVPVPGRAEE